MSIRKSGVSPVVGIILLTAVTVALVSLAAFFVFDVGQSGNSGIGTATVTVEYTSESRIDVQLIKQGSADSVIVKSALGTEYTLNSTGDSVTLLNQESNITPVVLSERRSERTVVRSIPPQSFTADIVVSPGTGGDYSKIQRALDNARDGSIIVLKRGVYYENIDVTTPNLTLVGETGTVIADNSSDNAVIDIQSRGVRVSNVVVNGSSGVGGESASYGINGGRQATTSLVTIVNISTNNTEGLVSLVSDTRFISRNGFSTSKTVNKDKIIPETPLVAWNTTYSSSHGNAAAYGVDVDSKQNIVVVGTADNNARVVKYNGIGSTKWTNEYRTGDAYFNDVQVDKNGDIIAVGAVNNGSNYDWLVVKYNSSGGREWTKTYNSTNGPDRAYGVGVDSQNDIVVTGYKDDGTSLDWRTVKYNSSGDKQWVKNFGTSNRDYSTAVTVDESDSVIVSGNTAGAWRVEKFNSTGSSQWVNTYDSQNGSESAFSVRTDDQNNIVVVGDKKQTDSQDVWRITKYNETGETKWVTTYDSGNGDDKPSSIAIDENGSIIVSGRKNNGINLDRRVAAYSPTGTEKWDKQYDGSGFDEADSVAIDAYGDVIAVGESNTEWRITKYTE